MAIPNHDRAAAEQYAAETEPSRAVNNGFWDRSPQERAGRMGEACDRAGVESFWDLSPEERARAYD